MSKIIEIEVKQQIIEYIIWYLEGKLNLKELIKVCKEQYLLLEEENAELSEAISTMEELDNAIKKNIVTSNVTDTITNAMDDILEALSQEGDILRKEVRKTKRIR